VSLRNFYLIMSVAGTVIPWAFFASFFASHGPNLPFFIANLFANGAAGGFSIDVMISIAVFWVWSFADAGKNHVRRWWLVIPAGFFVGLSLAMPLYFYLQAAAKDKENPSAAPAGG
jgi:hypothetical protein